MHQPSKFKKVHRLVDLCISVIADHFPVSDNQEEGGVDLLGIYARDQRLVSKLLRALKARGKLNSFAVRSIASEYTSKLDFSKALPVLNVEDLDYVSQTCRDLETLILSDCFSLNTNVLLNLIKNCTKLKRLDISRCQALSDDTLSRLSRIPECEKLQELRISNIPGITKTTIQELQQQLPDCNIISD